MRVVIQVPHQFEAHTGILTDAFGDLPPSRSGPHHQHPADLGAANEVRAVGNAVEDAHQQQRKVSGGYKQREQPAGNFPVTQEQHAGDGNRRQERAQGVAGQFIEKAEIFAGIVGGEQQQHAHPHDRESNVQTGFKRNRFLRNRFKEGNDIIQLRTQQGSQAKRPGYQQPIYQHR